MTTILFYKPYGVLSSFTGEPGQRTLAEFIDLPGVYAAGRLDMDSEGLLLLTDEGKLAHRITHPRYHLEKTYWVQVEGEPDEAALRRLERGVLLRGRRTRPARARRIPPPPLPPREKPVTPHGPTAWLEIKLREGKKRQVRRMTAAVGHPTLRLVRVAIGPLTLAGLHPGEWRPLRADELRRLHRALRQLRGGGAQGKRMPK